MGSVGFRLIRSDEYTLNYMEDCCKQYPGSDLNVVAGKLVAYVEKNNIDKTGSVEPDELVASGDFVDQEVITLLRHFGSQESCTIDLAQICGGQ